MHNRDVLISGGGVAGLALAYWLRHHGFTATVVERAPGLRSGGQAVDVRGAARTVVQRMGLLDEICEHHTGTHGIAFVDTDGRHLAELGGDMFGDSGGIVAEIEILRDDLHRLLHRTVRADVEYRYDDTITELTERDDGVEVGFARGARRTYDLVVGADGLRSGVRCLAFGDHSQYLTDLGYYAALFTARCDVDLGGWELMCYLPADNGVGGRAVVLYPVGDCGEVRAMLMFVAAPLDHADHDIEAHKAVLERAFDGAGWKLPGLLRSLRHSDDLYFGRAASVHVDRWSRGRTVLLGDAAFGGSLGMGTSMALVGAYVLAGELAAAGGDHSAALSSYETRLRDYVHRNQRRPPGAIAPRTERGIWVRTRMMRLMTRLPGKKTLMGNMQKAANAVHLEDYVAGRSPHGAAHRRP